LRHLEVRRRTEPEIRRALEAPSATPLDELTEQELRAAVWRALDLLPPRRREALVLVRLRGKSLEQAAGEMGLSRQTVANHISLALGDLESILKGYAE
jgi:RNA polymerase sigma-70 factor (ECF subfamily)